MHAGKLLKALFAEMSDSKVNYDKMEHSVAITDWLIENSPEDLVELADMLSGIFERRELGVDSVGFEADN